VDEARAPRSGARGGWESSEWRRRRDSWDVRLLGRAERAPAPDASPGQRRATAV